MRLSRITEADLEFTLALRNQNRCWFFNSDEVTREQHYQWYLSLAKRPDVDFRVIFIGDKRIGTVSTTRRDQRFEIGNMIIDRDHRGKGYAATAIKMQLAPGRTYFARVLPHNIDSQSLFKRLGFTRKTDSEWELLPLTQEC